ncbi:MAG: hypothetical protein A3J76_00445 [Candidatus Moranbacteria bacterium RBG_13_45_13]|nr:MAG: hypothetical protein A3J76_00445 [Candidatus Moranbacteria bacterium RBG_13_45_13]
MKKRKKPDSGIKIKFIAGAFVLILGLGYFYQAFFARHGMIAGEETENTSVNISELENKIGSGVEYTVSKNTGALTFIAAKKNKIPLPFEKALSYEPKVAAKYFMQEYGKYFGLAKPAKELLFAGAKSDERKMNHVAYVQKYKNIPVFGAQAVVHLKEDNSVSSASAKFVPNISSETRPKISQNRAVKEAKKYWEDWGHESKPENSKPRLLIFNRGLVEDKKSDANYLSWLVELWSREEGGHEYFFINARDGSFVYHLSGTRDMNRNIYDGNSGSYALSRSEGQGATGVADIDNAYDYLSGAHGYFQNSFGRNGANNQGGLGDGYASAYADTDAYVRIDNYPDKVYSCPNAWYDYYSIKFCSGEMTSDILGHEYTHGVTYNSVLYYSWPWGFDYEGESGAIDEAYSDIFGEAIESSLEGSCDWQMGEDSASGIFRRMDNPGLVDIGAGPHPGKMSDAGFYCGDWDYGGVHQNSTVFSHGAYLAAAGGTYNGYTISGVGIEATSQIFYRALVYYLGISSAFEDAYNALDASCNDLYGSGSVTCNEFQKALLAVELNQASPCEGGSTSQIATDVPYLYYSAKKGTKARINLTVSGINVKKKKHVKVRLSGKKTKVMRVGISGSSSVVNIRIKYGKWPKGNYNAVVTYKQKVGKSWQKRSISEDNILSIL